MAEKLISIFKCHLCIYIDVYIQRLAILSCQRLEPVSTAFSLFYLRDCVGRRDSAAVAARHKSFKWPLACVPQCPIRASGGDIERMTLESNGTSFRRGNVYACTTTHTPFSTVISTTDGMLLDLQIRIKNCLF